MRLHRLTLTSALVVLLLVGFSVQPAAATSLGDNLIRNGSFEYPSVSFAELVSDGGSIGAWRVVHGTVDLLGKAYYADGSAGQIIDLAGVSDGAISQKVATEPGRNYVLGFSLSANPDLNCEPVKTLVVRFGGQLIARLSVSYEGRSVEDLGWGRTRFRVTATNTQSTVTFRSLTGDSVCGALLDAISLRPIL